MGLEGYGELALRIQGAHRLYAAGQFGGVVCIVVDYHVAVGGLLFEVELEASLGTLVRCYGGCGALRFEFAGQMTGCQCRHGVLDVDVDRYAEFDVVDASAGIYKVEVYGAVAAAHVLGVVVAFVARVCADFN